MGWAAGQFVRVHLQMHWIYALFSDLHLTCPQLAVTKDINQASAFPSTSFSNCSKLKMNEKTFGTAVQQLLLKNLSFSIVESLHFRSFCWKICHTADAWKKIYSQVKQVHAAPNQQAIYNCWKKAPASVKISSLVPFFMTVPEWLTWTIYKGF